MHGVEETKTENKIATTLGQLLEELNPQPTNIDALRQATDMYNTALNPPSKLTEHLPTLIELLPIDNYVAFIKLFIENESPIDFDNINENSTTNQFRCQTDNFNTLLKGLRRKLNETTLEQVNEIINNFKDAGIKDPERRNYRVMIQKTLADCIIDRYIPYVFKHAKQDDFAFIPESMNAYDLDILNALTTQLTARISESNNAAAQSCYKALKIDVARKCQRHAEGEAILKAVQAAPAIILNILADFPALSVDSNPFDFRYLLKGDFKHYLEGKFTKNFEQKHVLAILDLLFIVQAFYSLAVITDNKITLRDLNEFKQRLHIAFSNMGRTRSLVFRENFAEKLGPHDLTLSMSIPVKLRLNLYIRNEDDLAKILSYVNINGRVISAPLPPLLKKLSTYHGTLHAVLIEGFLQKFQGALNEQIQPLTQLPPQFVECIQLQPISGEIFISPAMIMPTLMKKLDSRNEYHPLYLTLALSVLYASLKKDCPDNMLMGDIQGYLVKTIQLIQIKIKDHPYFKQYTNISINTGKDDSLTLMDYLTDKVGRDVDDETKIRHLRAVQMILSAIVDAYVLYDGTYEQLTAREQQDFQKALLTPFEMIGQATFGANKSKQFRDKIAEAFDENFSRLPPTAFSQSHETVLMQLQTAKSHNECVHILSNPNVLDYNIRPLFLWQNNEVSVDEDNMKKLCECLRFLPTVQWGEFIKTSRGIQAVQAWTDNEKATFLFYLMGTNFATYSGAWERYYISAQTVFGCKITEEIIPIYIRKIASVNGWLAATCAIKACFEYLITDKCQNVLKDIILLDIIPQGYIALLMGFHREIIAQMTPNDFNNLLTGMLKKWEPDVWLPIALWCWLDDTYTENFDSLLKTQGNNIEAIQRLRFCKSLLDNIKDTKHCAPEKILESLWNDWQNGCGSYNYTTSLQSFRRPRAQIVQYLSRIMEPSSLGNSLNERFLLAIFNEGLFDQQRARPDTTLQQFEKALIQQSSSEQILTVLKHNNAGELAPYVYAHRPVLVIDNIHDIIKTCYPRDTNGFISHFLRPLWNEIKGYITSENLEAFVACTFTREPDCQPASAQEKMALFIELCRLNYVELSDIIMYVSQYDPEIAAQAPMWLFKQKILKYDDFLTLNTTMVEKRIYPSPAGPVWETLSTRYFLSRFDDIVAGNEVRNDITRWNQALKQVRSFDLHKIITVLAEKMRLSESFTKGKTCYTLGLLHALAYLPLDYKKNQEIMCETMKSFMPSLELSTKIQSYFILLSTNGNRPESLRLTWNRSKPLTFRDYLLEKATSEKPYEQHAVLALIIVLQEAELDLLDGTFNIEPFKQSVTAACNGKKRNGHADLGKGRFDTFWNEIESVWNPESLATSTVPTCGYKRNDSSDDRLL